MSNSPSTKKVSVLISGASIAGPALAYWLTLYGFDVTIVERAPTLRKGGYAVDIRGTAIKVIERMCIADKVRAADTNMNGMHMVDSNGKRIAEMNEASMGNQRGIDIEIMRDDLTHILYDLTKETTEYIWGDSIAAITQCESGVEVSFTHSQLRTFDLVFGCDGLHSNVRNLVFGDESQFLRDLGCYISIFTMDNYLNLNHRQLVYNAPGKMASMYSARNNQEAKALFIFKAYTEQHGRIDSAAQKKIVVDAFANENGWEVQRMLKAIDAAPDFYFDTVAQIHMDRWSKGRVALVGDAAFGPSPASGQGTSLALVGAYILAGELKAAAGDYAVAFPNYEEQMQTFVEKNQQIAHMMTDDLGDDSKLKFWVRSQVVRIPGLMHFMYKLIEKKIAGAAECLVLKSY
jgi:2-polyprenyl-6-methoxyphenol hydroxylase-like FAD-dependent oxidoreductase